MKRPTDIKKYLYFFVNLKGFVFFKNRKPISKSALYWARYNSNEIIQGNTDIVVFMRKQQRF